VVAQNPTRSLGLSARDLPNRLVGGEEAVWSAFVGRGAWQLLEPKREGVGRENGRGGGSRAGAAWKEGNGREREGPRCVGR
jgi:hypothetical protein